MLTFFQKSRDKFQKLLFVIFFASSFKKFGKKSTIRFSFRINGPENIEIWDNVYVSENAWMLAYKNNTRPSLVIKKGTYIGRFVHIVSLQEIVLEEDVLIADKVYISDNVHRYEDINTPIKDQEVAFTNGVKIGKNSWVGENVCIMGAKIGTHCIIGANSVVRDDIPDYSIAVGAPAKVIKKYNHKRKVWERV